MWQNPASICTYTSYICVSWFILKCSLFQPSLVFHGYQTHSYFRYFVFSVTSTPNLCRPSSYFSYLYLNVLFLERPWVFIKSKKRHYVINPLLLKKYLYSIEYFLFIFGLFLSSISRAICLENICRINLKWNQKVNSLWSDVIMERKARLNLKVWVKPCGRAKLDMLQELSKPSWTLWIRVNSVKLGWNRQRAMQHLVKDLGLIRTMRGH